MTTSPTRPLVAAYYFPNYHADPLNAAHHGPGWTEWELVRRGEPRFAGHRQPLVPAWGYEDEADPAVMEKKIAAATSHGVDCFLFDWYYYDGPFLERCLNEGFLRAGNVGEMSFACMWANHDWVDIHPARRNVPPHTQFSATVTPETFETFTDSIIERYFQHPSHLRVDGAPFFSIYHLGLLVKQFGSMDAVRRVLDGFRARTIRAGFPGLHLNAIGSRGTILSGEDNTVSTYRAAAELGFDSIGNYVWAHFFPPAPEGPSIDYAAACRHYFESVRELGKQTTLPAYPNVTMGWDATPRVCASDRWDPTLGYPFTPVLARNTPAEFAAALRQARDFLTGQRGFSMVTLNAWNEWTEGSYLEPDTVTGLGYLEAVREVFGPTLYERRRNGPG